MTFKERLRNRPRLQESKETGGLIALRPPEGTGNHEEHRWEN